MEKYAFRCTQCGRLHTAGHAGENMTPAACAVCSGASWEVLADAPADRLAALGLSPKQIERHVALSYADGLRHDAERIHRTRAELTAKEQAWGKNKAAHLKEYKALVKRIKELDAALKKASPRDRAALIHEKDRARQRLTDLEGLEYAQRDAAHTAHLGHRLEAHEAALATGAGAGGVPRSVFADLADEAATGDQA